MTRSILVQNTFSRPPANCINDVCWTLNCT